VNDETLGEVGHLKHALDKLRTGHALALRQREAAIGKVEHIAELITEFEGKLEEKKAKLKQELTPENG